eukprot:gene10906-biopygen3067
MKPSIAFDFDEVKCNRRFHNNITLSRQARYRDEVVDKKLKEAERLVLMTVNMAEGGKPPEQWFQNDRERRREKRTAKKRHKRKQENDVEMWGTCTVHIEL